MTAVERNILWASWRPLIREILPGWRKPITVNCVLRVEWMCGPS